MYLTFFSLESFKGSVFVHLVSDCILLLSKTLLIFSSLSELLYLLDILHVVFHVFMFERVGGPDTVAASV